MKNLFSTSFLLLFLVLPFTDLVIAQQQLPANQQEFPVGAFLDIYRTNRYNPALYDTFRSSGMNTVWCHIDETTKGLLTGIENVIGDNEEGAHELIRHYSTGYYNKWEAEENTPYSPSSVGIGVKHKYGRRDTLNTVLCWSSKGLTSPKDSLMFGPHYHQEVLYHRYYFYPDWVDSYILKYIPRFSMALIKDPSVNQNENVCVIKVVHRYTKFTKQPDGSYDQGVRFEDVLRKDTLKVNRFRTDSSFSDIYFDEIIPKYYEYDNRFRPNYESMRTPQMRPSEQSTEFIYSDILLDNGIQFCVDWLRSDTLCALYIDYAEVYDNNGWAQFLEDPGGISSRIKDYAQEMDFTNLKYFAPGGEPGSLDAIVPIRTVDSLIRSATNKPINLGMTIPTTETGFWPPMNGEKLYEKILNAVQPEMMLNNYFPFYVGWEVPKSYEYLRAVLQESHNVYPNFWYCGQSQGYRTLEGPGDDWCFWRKPSSTELKGSVMLALAHGAKGMLFWLFNHRPPARNLSECDNTKHEYVDCIVDENLQPTDLYDVIKNDFAPRLKGTLGKTLLGLSYTGNFIQLKRLSNLNQIIEASYYYLKIKTISTGNEINFHAGFLSNNAQVENNYFLLTNLITTSGRQVELTINGYGNSNTRFRNMEPSNNFDLTFQGQTIQTLNLPAGEGYLFQVAPVVKYGGKLIYSETVTNGTTLYDDMTIENGATLTINDTYNAKANITVKSGGKIIAGPNGKIIFDPGKNLVIDGNAQVYGTSNTNRLTLDFNSSTATGVEVRFNNALTMSYCDIKNANVGINAECASYINISNVTFTNCHGSGIVLFSFGNCDSNLPSYASTISNCTINGSSTGISVVNSDEVVITENSTNNCNLGIYLNQVNSTHISSNNIIGYSYPNGSTMPGILMSSCGGYLRNNTIKYHKYGVQLAYSSPDLGLNTIEENAQCGLFVDIGSYPNLIQKLVNENC